MPTTFRVITATGPGSLTVPMGATLTKIELWGAGSSAAYGTGGGAGGRDYLACSYAAGTQINWYNGAAGLASFGALSGGGGGYTWAGPSPIASYTYAPVRAKGGGTGAAGKQVDVGYGPHGGHGHTADAKTGGNGANAGYGGAGGGAGGTNGNGGAGGYGSALTTGGGGGGAPSGGTAGYNTSGSAGGMGGKSFSGASGGAGGNPGPGVRGNPGTGSGGGYAGASGANGSNGTDGLDGVHGAGGGAGAGGYNGGVGGSGGLFGGGGAAGGYITPPAGLDAINFGQFGPPGTQHPNNTTGTTVNGVTFHVTTNYAGGFQSLVQTSGGWQGMFWTSVYGGYMIFNGKNLVANGTSPITLTFDTPISGLKHVAVQADDFGIFYGYMKAYNGATYLGGQQIVADDHGNANSIPPMFFGSGSANITKIVFSATNNVQGIGLGPCPAPSAGPGIGGNGGPGGIIFQFTTTAAVTAQAQVF